MNFIMLVWGILIAVDAQQNVNVENLALPEPTFIMPQACLVGGHYECTWIHIIPTESENKQRWH